jgi:hypothetical protein
MGKLSKGLKAGLAAGVIYAGLVAVTLLVLFLAFRSVEILNLTVVYPKNATQVYSILLVSVPTFYGIVSLIVGVIFGVAFTLSYAHLLGRTSTRKGMFLGIFVFLFNLFVIGIGYVANTPEYLAIAVSVVAFGSTIAYGYVLGFFYDRFERTQPTASETMAKPS